MQSLQPLWNLPETEFRNQIVHPAPMFQTHLLRKSPHFLLFPVLLPVFPVPPLSSLAEQLPLHCQKDPMLCSGTAQKFVQTFLQFWLLLSTNPLMSQYILPHFQLGIQPFHLGLLQLLLSSGELLPTHHNMQDRVSVLRNLHQL